jgi:hypothetical protein
MADTPVFDHIALNVANLTEQVERLTTAFGMEVQIEFDGFAVLVDPGTGLKFELGISPDQNVHVRHLGFRADDVDAAHEGLLAVGMETVRAPQRQDFSRMYTSYLGQPGGVEIQLVKYDD